jgi:tetratricopeptide (TPR) repeat protein
MVDLIKANNIELQPKQEVEPQHFFSVSAFKLIVMLVGTFGLYELYWLYKNWVFIKHKTGRDIFPFWRTVFSNIWIYSFFKYIKLFSLKARLKIRIYPGLWAIIYIVLSLIIYASDEVLPSILLFLLIVRCNQILLNINSKLFPNFQNNTKFTISSYIALGIGGLIWLLIIYGSFTNENLQQAEELHNQGKYQESIEFYDKAIEYDPKSSLAYANKCNNLIKIKKYEEALHVCDKAIEYNPKLAAVYNDKGVALYELGKNEEAIEYYNKAIELDLKSSLTYINKCIVLNKIGRYEEAIGNCNKGIELDPKSMGAYSQKTYSLINLKKYEEALYACNKAIELDKGSLSILYKAKAAILEQLGRNDEAQAAYDEAARIDAKNTARK